MRRQEKLKRHKLIPNVKKMQKKKKNYRLKSYMLHDYHLSILKWLQLCIQMLQDLSITNGTYFNNIFENIMKV